MSVIEPVIDEDGTKKWYLNGRLHRTDGPAVERADDKFWYLNGKIYSFNKYVIAAGWTGEQIVMWKLTQ